MSLQAPQRDVFQETWSGGIRLTGVTKLYKIGGGEVQALAGIDVEIGAATLTVILGPSGSGKTTLLNIIAGLDRPTSGTVEVAGHSIVNASRSALTKLRREHISFIFQTFNLFPGLNALENVEFGARISRVPDPRGVARRALAEVGLGDRLQHFPHELSGGEQQRVAIARALSTGNPILLVDEPTGELDFRTGVQILELLQEQSARGATIVVVTHNREIARAADRVIELSGGRVISDAPPDGGRLPATLLHW